MAPRSPLGRSREGSASNKRRTPLLSEARLIRKGDWSPVWTPYSGDSSSTDSSSVVEGLSASPDSKSISAIESSAEAVGASSATGGGVSADGEQPAIEINPATTRNPVNAFIGSPSNTSSNEANDLRAGTHRLCGGVYAEHSLIEGLKTVKTINFDEKNHAIGRWQSA